MPTTDTEFTLELIDWLTNLSSSQLTQVTQIYSLCMEQGTLAFVFEYTASVKAGVDQA